MIAFARACEIGDRGAADLVALLEWLFPDGAICLLPPGTRNFEAQVTHGDALLNTGDDRRFFVEFKTEEENRFGNLFVETWSNRSSLRRGWLETSRADMLLYYFLRDGEAFSVPLGGLRRWLYGDGMSPGAIHQYPEKRQNKREQHNDTWGHPVPIADIRRNVGLRRYRFDGMSWSKAPIEEM